jgi:hypothetical protein
LRIGVERAQGVGQFGERGLDLDLHARWDAVAALAQVHLEQVAFGADLHVQRLLGIRERCASLVRWPRPLFFQGNLDRSAQ